MVPVSDHGSEFPTGHETFGIQRFGMIWDCSFAGQDFQGANESLEQKKEGKNNILRKIDTNHHRNVTQKL